MLNSEKDEIIKNTIKNIKVEDYSSYEIEKIIDIANKRKRNKNIMRVVTVFVSTFIISFMILLYQKSFDNQTHLSADNSDENLYSKTIILNETNSNNYISDSFPDIIAIVKVNKIVENKFEEYEPKTLVEAEILEVRSGECFEEIIRFYIEQCIVENITEEMRGDFNIGDENIKKIRIVKNESLSKLEYPTVNSIYIVALKNVNDTLYVDTEYKYSFYQVDIENSLVYIDGNWKEIEK